MNAKALIQYCLWCTLTLVTGCGTTISPGGEQEGIGGTGVIAQQDPDGIGGTGVIDPDTDSGDGIGGTGAWPSGGDVALYGVITHLDPLVVNGHGMLVNNDTTLSMNGESLEITELAVGQVAWVRAGIRNGAIMALELAAQSAVRGLIDVYNTEQNTITVLGQKIFTNGLNESQRDQLAEGAWVDIAGIRDLEGNIEASFAVFLGNEQASGIESPSNDASLPFEGQVAAYSVQTYIAIGNNQLILNPRSAASGSIAMQAKEVPGISNLAGDQAVIVEFKPGRDKQFELKAIRPAIIQEPNHTIIPQYRPPTPNGSLNPGQGMQLPNRAPGDIGKQIDTGLDGKMVSPPRAPLPSPSPVGSGPTPTRVIDSIPRGPIKLRPPVASPSAQDALPAISSPR